jgi:hypothetical protein
MRMRQRPLGSGASRIAAAHYAGSHASLELLVVLRWDTAAGEEAFLGGRLED